MSGDELELKAVVPDPAALRAALGTAGASLGWRGMMHDRRYDRGDELAARDEVLRTRVRHEVSDAPGGTRRAELTWKGPTRRSPEGYKLRRELELPVEGDADPDGLLRVLGYRVIHAIDRWIEQYDLGGAMVRLEWYPRMDVLVEIEGGPEAIERAIAASGIARAAFSADTLAEFASRYQRARGRPAALALGELAGEPPFLGGGVSAAGVRDLVVPEFGPALGRLATVPGAPSGPPPVPLACFAGLRLELVTALFERAGAARRALAAGDGRGAAELLAPATWRALWSDFTERAAALVRGRIDAELARAAAASGYPPRRLERLRVTDAEGAGIALRLSGAGAPLLAALDQLDRSISGTGWGGALIEAARGLEEGWFALEAAAAMEEEAWFPEAVRLRRWRPARWPRRVAAGAVVAGALYAGLMLGGYLPVPGALRPAAQYWWGEIER